MSDLERTIREARKALPEPRHDVTERALAATIAVAPRWSRRSTRRIAVGAIVFAAALAGAFVAGLAVASGGATKVTANGPGFLPSAGWQTFQTGLTEEPIAPTATAATIPLREDVLSETFPWRTVATLRQGQVLLHAIFYRSGEIEGIDEQFPRRSTPLSLADAQPGASLEGQPPNVRALRLNARVHGWNLDLFVFVGGAITEAARAAAQEELERLVMPEAPPGPLTTRPALRQSRNACRPSALRATVYLQGATGTSLGGIRVRNTGAQPCRLRGRPTVELRDANGVRLGMRQRPAPPLWKQMGAARPPGWPTIRLAPGGTAQVFVQLSNWCVVPARPVFFRTYLPGVGAPIPAPARVTLRCDDPRAPVNLSVGPVEPVR